MKGATLTASMILILHGHNQQAANDYIAGKIAALKQQPQRLENPNPNDLYLAIFSEKLLESQNLIICQNFFKNNKTIPPFLKDIPKEKTIIFWEQYQLSPAVESKLKKWAQVTNFKPEPKIFKFLDSISSNPHTIIKQMNSLDQDDDKGLLWHLQNRFLQLILYLKGIDMELAQQISGHKILPFQWEKIKYQSKNLGASTLHNLYSATLKVEHLIKSGKTDLPVRTLLSLLFLKYLHGNR